MGYNSTLIVMNDALHEIANDPEFGHKLVRAIQSLSIADAYTSRMGANISAGMHCNAATAIESHHADGNAIIAVGGNCATVLGMTFGTHHEEEDKLIILKQLAHHLGYSLRKSPARKG